MSSAMVRDQRPSNLRSDACAFGVPGGMVSHHHHHPPHHLHQLQYVASAPHLCLQLWCIISAPHTLNRIPVPFGLGRSGHPHHHHHLHHHQHPPSPSPSAEVPSACPTRPAAPTMTTIPLACSLSLWHAACTSASVEPHHPRTASPAGARTSRHTEPSTLRHWASAGGLGLKI